MQERDRDKWMKDRVDDKLVKEMIKIPSYLNLELILEINSLYRKYMVKSHLTIANSS
jgi:hypothetical protein